jgi:hypothetical protein
MSSFLTDLERDLVAAHPRRRAARRRAALGRTAHAAPVVVLLAAVLLGAGTFLLAVGRDDEERAATPGPSPAAVPPTLRERDPADAGERVAVLNGTTKPGLGRAVRDFLEPEIRIGTIANAPNARVARTTVAFARSARARARGFRVGSLLDAPARRLDARTREAAAGADVAVVVGRDLRGISTAPLIAVGGGRIGTVDVLDRGSRGLMAVEASVRPARRGRAYGLWAAGPGERLRFLGFPTPQGGDRLSAFAAVRPPSQISEVVVSAESSRRPPGRTPANPVAVARFG